MRENIHFRSGRVGDSPASAQFLRGIRRGEERLTTVDMALYPSGEFRPAHRDQLVGHGLAVGRHNTVHGRPSGPSLLTQFSHPGESPCQRRRGLPEHLFQVFEFQNLRHVPDVQVQVDVGRRHPFRQCDRSPRPLRVGVKTSAPDLRSKGTTFSSTSRRAKRRAPARKSPFAVLRRLSVWVRPLAGFPGRVTGAPGVKPTRSGPIPTQIQYPTQGPVRPVVV